MFEHPIGTINKRLTESTFFPSNWTEPGNSTIKKKNKGERKIIFLK